MKKIILVPFAVLLFSCNSTKKATDAKPATEVKKPSTELYQVLSESGYQGKEEKSFEVIKDNYSLEKLYTAINDPQIPKVDFSKSRIVALFLGQRTSGGYGIKVKSVSEKGDKIYVTVEETKPKPGDMVTMAITNPFTIVKINSTKEIIFQ